MINLKKLLITISLILLVVFSIPLALDTSIFSATNNKDDKSELVNLYIPTKRSREELHQDLFMTLLLPTIQSSINDYYKEFLSVAPSISPDEIEVLRADRLGEYRTFDFLLKLQVLPYVGPRVNVGTDYITLRINAIDKVKVEKFEHIKSPTLPRYYQKITQ